MKYMTVKNKVKDTRRGAFSSLLWEREVKTKKGCADCIKKRVRATVRFGIDYDHMKAVQEGRKDGILPSKNTGLPWGHWDEYPYFIEHTPKGAITPVHYLRAYIGTGANLTTTYYLNGREVDKKVIEPMVLKSELKDELVGEKPITVKVSDILAIG